MSAKDLYNKKYNPGKIIPKVETKTTEMKDFFAPKNIYTSPNDKKNEVESVSAGTLYKRKFAPEKIVAPQPQIPSYLKKTEPVATETQKKPEEETSPSSNIFTTFSTSIPSVFQPFKTVKNLAEVSADLKKEEDKKIKNEEVKKYNLKQDTWAKEISRLLLPQKAEEFFGINRIKQQNTTNNFQAPVGENLNKSQKTKADEIINHIIKPQVKKTVMERDSLKNTSPLEYNIANRLKIFDENSRDLEGIMAQAFYTPYDILDKVVYERIDKIINSDDVSFDFVGITGLSTREKAKVLKLSKEKFNEVLLWGANTKAGLETIDFVSKNSADLPLKGYSLLKSIGESTYKDEYEKMKNDLSGENSNYFTRTLDQTQSSIGQTGLGVLLSLSLGKINPRLGQAVSGAYWGALSASEQVEETGKVYNINKILIDVVGDSYLGNQIEKTLKTPNSLLKKTLISAHVEGGTEVGQSILKFAEDYKEAETIEKKEQVIADTEEYINSGAFATEYLVGGLSGAGISAVAGGVNSIVNVKNNKKAQEDLEKDIEKIEKAVTEFKNTTINKKEITTEKDKKEIIALLEAGTEKLMIASQNYKLLAEGTPQTNFQGEGFTMTDRADPLKTKQSKLMADYKKMLANYNQNPTPYKLKVLMNKRATLRTAFGKTEQTNVKTAIADNTSAINKQTEVLKKDNIAEDARVATEKVDALVDAIGQDTLASEVKNFNTVDDFVNSQGLDKNIYNVYSKLYGKNTNKPSEFTKISQGEKMGEYSQGGTLENSGQNIESNLTELSKEITNNPDGFTLNLNGEPVTDGFSVSPYKGRELKVDVVTEEILEQYITDNIDLFVEENNKIGGWLNNKDNKFYLDVSVISDNVDDAIGTAVKNNQIAIYDLKNGKEIVTKDFLENKLREFYNKTKIETKKKEVKKTEPTPKPTPKKTDAKTGDSKTFKSKIFEDYKKVYNLGDLESVETEKMIRKEEFEKAGEFTLNNPEKAVQIAYTGENIPNGYRLIAIQGAVAEYLLEKGNKELSYEIMRKQSAEISKVAQDLGLAAMGVSNFTQQLNNIEKERLARFGAKTSKLKGADLIKQAKIEVNTKTKERAKTVRENINKNLEQSLENFDSILDSLLC